MLNRDSILNANDFETTEVDVPEWGGTVILRGLSAADRDHYEAEFAQTQDMTNMRSRLVVKALVDHEGNRLFTDKDADELGKKNARVVLRLFDLVRQMSGMSDEDLGIAEGN